MSDYTKVTIESDSAGRLSIGATDERGCGTGYRLAGPKYINDVVTGRHAKSLAEVELTERDVKEIRYYLGIWDEIQARKAAASDDTEVSA